MSECAGEGERVKRRGRLGREEVSAILNDERKQAREEARDEAEERSRAMPAA